MARKDGYTATTLKKGYGSANVKESKLNKGGDKSWKGKK